MKQLMDGEEPSLKVAKTETSTSAEKTSGFIQLPEIVTIILLYLEARDVCLLGSCSQVLHSVCNSNYVWKELYKRRWPKQFINSSELLEPCRNGVIHGVKSSGLTSFPAVHSQGWKAQYIKRHVEMASKISGFLASIDTWMIKKYLCVSRFLEAVNLLNSMELSFGDVCSVLFSTKLSVHANLIGLQYSIISLGVVSKDVKEAVVSQGVAERQVRLKWFTKSKYFDHLFVPEQRCYLTCSLGKIAMDKEVVALLNRGPTRNVGMLRIGTLPDQEMKQTNQLSIS